VENSIEELRYPIGHFTKPSEITQKHLDEWIHVLEFLPARLEAMVKDLTAEQLATPYRPEGWTVQQLIHHISDSHHNSYIRFKWALTEEKPIIKAYNEKEWAALFDSRKAPIAMSLKHLEAVHAKLVFLLKGLSSNDLKRTFIHPEGNVESSLKENIGRYAWHSNHHFAHIEGLLQRKGWL